MESISPPSTSMQPSKKPVLTVQIPLYEPYGPTPIREISEKDYNEILRIREILNKLDSDKKHATNPSCNNQESLKSKQIRSLTQKRNPSKKKMTDDIKKNDSNYPKNSIEWTSTIYLKKHPPSHLNQKTFSLHLDPHCIKK